MTVSNKPEVHVRIPSGFTREHERALTVFLNDDRRLDTPMRQKLFEAIELLGEAELKVNTSSYTFAQIYEQYIDRSFADTYIEQLLTLVDIAAQGPALSARFAKQIAAVLQQANFLTRESPQSYLLFAYCVYWWQSFARGYGFEVEIMRDLRASGLDFTMHDIRDRSERYSPADLIVLGLLGDIKTSIYFLQTQSAGPLTNDFYITRLYDKGYVRTLVVFQNPHAWQKIKGGQTAIGHLHNILDLLPQPVQLEQAESKLIVVVYEDWKERVRRTQADERGHDDRALTD